MKTSTNKILTIAISFLSGFCACFLLLNPSRQQPHGPAIPVAATLASTQPGQPVIHLTMPPGPGTPNTLPIHFDPVDPTLPGPTQQHKDLIDTRPHKD